jgi:hypothetical protein
MISPEDIREKACRLWSGGRALRAALGVEALFPYPVPFAKPSAREWLSGFAELRSALERLEAASKAGTGAGYTLVTRDIAHQKLGSLRVPERIVFENIGDLAACAGESATLRRFEALVDTLESREPRLLPWIAERPLQALEQDHAIPQLLAVAEYFQAHPRPMRFARELGIPGVDSKFIEAYRGVLADWLQRLLPPDAIDATAARGLADNGFERRFGLRHEEAVIRFRWLDPAMALEGCISDAAVPLSQLAAYMPPCTRVLVTENKINFLTLPHSEATLALFGGGYAIDRLASVPWLRTMPIHYWGDIDTHGFAILGRLRGHLPDVRSFLMDRETLMAHRDFWSTEAPDCRCLRELAGLDDAERALYDDLREDRLGTGVRLEQERIGYTHVTAAVQSLGKVLAIP